MYLISSNHWSRHQCCKPEKQPLDWADSHQEYKHQAVTNDQEKISDIYLAGNLWVSVLIVCCQANVGWKRFNENIYGIHHPPFHRKTVVLQTLFWWGSNAIILKQYKYWEKRWTHTFIGRHVCYSQPFEGYLIACLWNRSGSRGLGEGGCKWGGDFFWQIL